MNFHQSVVVLAHYKEPEIIDGRQLFGNDPLPAILRYNTDSDEDKVEVQWINGWWCQTKLKYLNVYSLPSIVDIFVFKHKI